MNVDVNISNIKLETDRLILRSWEITDLEDFYEYASVEGVGELAGWDHHQNIEESKKILDMFIKDKKVFAIELKENNKVIGSLGIEEYEDELEELNLLKGGEIGFVISKEYWGRKIAPEAVLKVIDYCFNELGYDFLVCSHFIENKQSKRVIEKSGFKFYKNIDLKISRGIIKEAKMYLLFNENKAINKKI
ncbi:GNAT family N-acetyltransferase [Miniphocaeibacter halophilus]|uniref:GNAT family N-acetyltransferase n=1 Tax=Miniphocaeibacter halophilus TaxID=2931922 RepID=A0AC61MVB3_9FIRM|nr:GNAT family N-acetyltransferase [Miniphocaeibacter halophilus]QQK07999.1 GNAT family N-acetyltransferase [Miniphocaeibacter halophilus]